MGLSAKLVDATASQQDIVDLMKEKVSIYRCKDNNLVSNVKNIVFKNLTIVPLLENCSDVVVGDLDFHCENCDIYYFNPGSRIFPSIQPVEKKDSEDRFHVNINPYEWTQLYKRITYISF